MASDRRSSFGVAGDGSVASPALLDRLQRSSADELRCREVGLANAEIENGPALCAHLLEARTEFQGCGGLDGPDSLADQMVTPPELLQRDPRGPLDDR